MGYIDFSTRVSHIYRKRPVNARHEARIKTVRDGEQQNAQQNRGAYRPVAEVAVPFANEHLSG